MRPHLAMLRDTILRHATEPHTRTRLPGLTLFRSECQTLPADCICRPRLCIVVQGSKQVIIGSHTFTYDAEKYLIATVDLPVTGCVTQATADAPYLSLSLDLDPAEIATFLLTITPSDARTGAGVAVSTLTEDLLCPATRLTALLDTPDDIPVLAPLIKKEIAWRLLQGEQGALLRQIALADSYLSQISRAIAWIRDHYAEAFDIDTVAKTAGMSTPSFYRHFRAVTMMSPLQYRTRIRLQEARKRLLTDGEDAAEAGFAVGYESPSQFSRDYRRLFGTPPARDVARLRSATGQEHSPLSETV
ncbi:AraC family transcriptional regulator [Acetobacter oeni]|uniref:AraC family transcriptional regulator n=1 Tax=Acetobacter oeni TaxID=304077 RepID=A0A511XMP4_9PROT|nr:AraC family transcriptional regulator [Acetobacter oeni]MBB3884145.1 AraC-like DNA-binding protein [Acetobacter oeni]NHO20147.1 helix-turn-helix domain-containing protein [Acetobacter oeni]GBR04372.1 transcriptional regulator [Acetobacter oeni LMG 21952]GEN64209.1 AraC family transcriptional regulator [Acetobacter oeni]